MKKSLLIKLHLYCGLFTSFYLLAFGFSSIVLNHKIDVENHDITHEWNTTVHIDQRLSDLQLAESLRAQLGLMGWLPGWEFRRDSAGFKFLIIHPGRKYYLDANLSNGRVQVEEIPLGFLAVFHGLHFLNGKVPNAPLLIRSWAVYQWLALLVMALSLVLGLWLWLKYSYRPWHGLVFGTLFLATLILMLLV